MVVDTLFLCICEDRNRNEDGRWKSSKLAELGDAKHDRDGVELRDVQEKY